jgi:hypothetical protein
MTKFRFHLHTWSPAEGHRDRRIIVRGETMPVAFEILTRTLEARETGVIINAKAFETVTD